MPHSTLGHTMVKLSLFTHVRSGPLSLAARLHLCCPNHSHCINNGWAFSRQTLYDRHSTNIYWFNEFQTIPLRPPHVSLWIWYDTHWYHYRLQFPWRLDTFKNHAIISLSIMLSPGPTMLSQKERLPSFFVWWNSIPLCKCTTALSTPLLIVTFSSQSEKDKYHMISLIMGD